MGQPRRDGNSEVLQMIEMWHVLGALRVCFSLFTSPFRDLTVSFRELSSFITHTRISDSGMGPLRLLDSFYLASRFYNRAWDTQVIFECDSDLLPVMRRPTSFVTLVSQAFTHQFREERLPKASLNVGWLCLERWDELRFRDVRAIPRLLRRSIRHSTLNSG